MVLNTIKIDLILLFNHLAL